MQSNTLQSVAYDFKTPSSITNTAPTTNQVATTTNQSHHQAFEENDIFFSLSKIPQQQQQSVSRQLDKTIVVFNETTQESLTFTKEEIQVTCSTESSFWLPDLIEQLKCKVADITNSFLSMWDDERGTFQYLGPYTGILPMNIKLDKFRNSNSIYINFKPMDEYDAAALLFNSQQPSFNQNETNIVNNNLNCSNTNNLASNPERAESGQQSGFAPSIPNGSSNVDQAGQELQKKPRKKKQMKPEKRIKERTIQEVIDKVAEWRSLHESGDKINLDKAANKVGISRKTLDDYNLQMRRARDFGFDFELNNGKKMGVLRKFVKTKQQEESKLDDENCKNNNNKSNRKISYGELSTTEVDGQHQFSSELKDLVVDIDIFINDNNSSNNSSNNSNNYNYSNNNSGASTRKNTSIVGSNSNLEFSNDQNNNNNLFNFTQDNNGNQNNIIEAKNDNRYYNFLGDKMEFEQQAQQQNQQQFQQQFQQESQNQEQNFNFTDFDIFAPEQQQQQFEQQPVEVQQQQQQQQQQQCFSEFNFFDMNNNNFGDDNDYQFLGQSNLKMEDDGFNNNQLI